MIFQNPRTTLHPMLTVGKQMDNVLRAHMELSKSERRARILDHLDLVGIPNPSRVAGAYPHELSGGMSQRVVIASSLLCDPSVVIADEPTTGLDATVQRQILDLLAGLQSELGLSVLMITHDLSIVAQYCTAVTVMYQGSVVEHGRSRDVLKNPQADYTRNLIKASALDLELLDDVDAPAVSTAKQQPDYEHAIEVRDLVKRFPGRGGDADVVAINSVSFTVPRGSTLGIIGESGSGKSTLVRCMLGLVEADSGSSQVLGIEAVHRTDRHKRELRRRSQIVFQEPFEALDPRMRISDAIAEPLQIHSRMRGSELTARVAELMELVMLDPTLAERFPHQLSGGQQQRVNIARALATNPEVLVLDEPTSALDVAVRSEILALLKWLQRRLDMTYVLVSHDLTTVRSVCTDVAVMYFGNIVEMGKTDDVLDRAEHAYTKHLLSSALSLDPDERPEPLAAKPPIHASGSPAQTS
jgi:peptide/nickel transport system ATP-binding protein